MLLDWLNGVPDVAPAVATYYVTDWPWCFILSLWQSIRKNVRRLSKSKTKHLMYNNDYDDDDNNNNNNDH